MRISTVLGRPIVVAAFGILLASCATNSTTPASPATSATAPLQSAGKSWMVQPDATASLTYMSDYVANNVTVYGRNANVQGQIGGLSGPQGIYVDAQRNLWVTNSGTRTVLEFARGATSPTLTLDDSNGDPDDVTVCPDGTVYVANIFLYSSGHGNVEIYAPGSTEPTGALSFPGSLTYFGVTCDTSGNVFVVVDRKLSYGEVLVFPNGAQAGAHNLGIKLGFPGGIKATNGGNLFVADQAAHTITEYSESGVATGQAINTLKTDFIADIAVTPNGKVVGEVDSVGLHGKGISWSFPLGEKRQTYVDANPPDSSLPRGFAFDPEAP